MNIKTRTIGAKVAGALLVHYGQLSVDDIRAMPFFSGPEEAEQVVELLLRTFNADIRSIRVSSDPVPQWEQLIMLRR